MFLLPIHYASAEKELTNVNDGSALAPKPLGYITLEELESHQLSFGKGVC